MCGHVSLCLGPPGCYIHMHRHTESAHWAFVFPGAGLGTHRNTSGAGTWSLSWRSQICTYQRNFWCFYTKSQVPRYIGAMEISNSHNHWEHKTTCTTTAPSSSHTHTQVYTGHHHAACTVCWSLSKAGPIAFESDQHGEVWYRSW